MSRKPKIFTEEYVPINGLEHYMVHYPANPEAPVLLHIHGGPGQSESLFAYYIDDFAERNYTIVYYDQRAANKTYLKAKKDRPTVDDLLDDLLQIVLYLRKKYNKDKIAILGHSWGTVLGSLFVLSRPEYVSAYIGTGQVIDTLENERVGLEKLRDAVGKSGNKGNKKKLMNYADYPNTDKPPLDFLRDMGKVRGLQGKYGLAASPSGRLMNIARKSPVMKLSDLIFLFKSMYINLGLVTYMMTFSLYKLSRDYSMPVYYLLGEKDYQTPSEIAAKYFETINAPQKKLYMIPNAGHMAALENVEVFRKAVCEIAGTLK